MSSDDKYIIRPGGDSSDHDPSSGNDDMNEMSSLEEYVFANSVVQNALVNLLVEKGVITLEDLSTEVEKIRNQI